MKKLHLSKKKIRLARILWIGGFVGAIVSLFLFGGVGIPFFICLALLMIGWLQLDTMYRCPHCGYPLFDTKLEALKQRVKSSCPKCDEPITVEMEP